MSDLYVIWSHEHTAWWAPNGQGYVRDLAKAGRYSAAEAGRWVVQAYPPGIEVAVDELIAIRHGTDRIFGMPLEGKDG